MASPLRRDEPPRLKQIGRRPEPPLWLREEREGDHEVEHTARLLQENSRAKSFPHCHHHHLKHHRDHHRYHHHSHRHHHQMTHYALPTATRQKKGATSRQHGPDARLRKLAHV
eukprot:1125273-Pleurochrysis_carterae.AAC.2